MFRTNQQRPAWGRHSVLGGTLFAVWVATAGVAAADEAPTPSPPPVPQPSPPPEPEPDGPRCKLESDEAPRGGQITILGEELGKTPVVRIGDRVTRILLHKPGHIEVQVPAASKGGPVTVQVARERILCGHLKIIGLDR